MWWQDLLWGFWNGITAWIVLIVHVFGAWDQFPVFNIARSGNWYDFGFLLGAASPLIGPASAVRGAAVPKPARPPKRGTDEQSHAV